MQTEAPLFVHIPAHLLAVRLPFLRNRNLQPEVAFHLINPKKIDLAELRDLSAQLASAGLATSLHAPFANFAPGSPKSRLQKKSRAVAELAFTIAEALAATRIVFHPGLPLNPSAKVLQQWQQNSLAFWPDYIQQAEQLKTMICLENIFEATPQPFLPLFEQLAGPAFGHCFDIGHWNMFSNGSLNDWFACLGGYINHLHLHDNHGQQDEHLPIGHGIIDFSELFSLLRTLPQPPGMTLEAHTLPELDASLAAIKTFLPKA